MYPHGLIGNCQSSALISVNGSVDWLCFPRPDSAPVFGRVLDPEGGHFAIEGIGDYIGQQEYIPNTTVLVTTLKSSDGNVFRITDFFPRFIQFGRVYRPMALFRMVEPVSGSPSIRVSCQPVNGWSKEAAKAVRGNSHLRFDLQEDAMRLTTNMPLTYLTEGSSFQLKEPLYFGLTWSTAIEEDLVPLTHRFLDQTIDYWKTWVKHCSIPSLFQKETIRSALTLKLHCYEDTGAILAALTTSLPEQIGRTRNWDYRFCWLRDSYFVLSALHKLGHFEEMEGFVKFLLNIAEKHEHSRERLRPVYQLDQSLPLPEYEHGNWVGYLGSAPVRSNNQAAEHVQNDVYGEMVLTLAPIFLDERFHHLRTSDHEQLMAHLARLCVRNISKPDAGLWEIRDGWKEHTFSNLMCWAGIDRSLRLKQKGFLGTFDLDLEQARAVAEKAVRAAAMEGSLRNGPTDETFDSSLLLAANLGFPDEDLVRTTVDRIHTELRLGTDPVSGSFLYRYRRQDDFGTPDSAFLICSFWLVQALAKIGRVKDAHEVMRNVLSAATPLGLFSEHYIPGEKQQTGNFPQAYSHVGLINAAFAISPPWEDMI